jgi:Family of unknown function (DUF6519)
MIARVIAGLAAIAFFGAVRRWRRRKRHAKENPPMMTVRYGYTGLENQTYRVAIERGSPNAATFTWSRDGERGSARQSVPVQAGTWIQLEDGIEVRFAGDRAFSPGDFWTFPARSAADTVTMKARRRGAPSARGRAKRRR